MAQANLLENFDEGKAPVFSPVVTLHDGRPATTSLAIAKHFYKPHDKVLRDIRVLCANCPKEFSVANFGGAEYEDEQGKPRPMFTVFFDGFILLVMGYTGKKALQVKLMYIGAFNAMKKKLDKLAGDERARLEGDVKALPADAFPEASTTLTKSTVDDREPIRQIVDTWAELAEKPHFLLYRQLRAAFQIKNIKELPAEWVPDAVAWVQERIDSLQRALPPSSLPVAKGQASAPASLIDEAAMTEPALWDEKLQFFGYICEEGYRGIHTYRRMVMEEGTKLYREWLDFVFPGTANRERRVELAAVYHHSLRDMVDRMCCCGDELTPEHNPATALSTFTRAVGLLSNGGRG